MLSVLIVRPSYDPKTAITAEWGKEIVEYARGRGYKVIDLEGDLARPDMFLKAIRQEDPRFILHYGHGKADALLGQDGIPLVTIQDVSLLKGRHTQSVSCKSGEKMGEEIARIGGTFSGYTDFFLFTEAQGELFKKCVNAQARAIIDGKTVGEAHKIGQDTYREVICKEIEKEREFLELTLKLLDDFRLRLPEPLYMVIREICKLRSEAIENERRNLDNINKRSIAGLKTLQAFRQTEFADSLLQGLPISKEIDFCSRLVSHIKSSWIIRCPRCNTVNATSFKHCTKCGKFLLLTEIRLRKQSRQNLLSVTIKKDSWNKQKNRTIEGNCNGEDEESRKTVKA